MSEENKKSYHWDSGKGSRPRSYSVTQEEFSQKFDAIDWSVKADNKEPDFKVEHWAGGTIIYGSIDAANVQWKIDAEGNIVAEQEVKDE